MKTKSNIILLIVVAVFLTVNLVMMSMLLSRPISQCPVKLKSLPCEAMPIKFALDYPDCANKLLMAMNITNVKVALYNSTNTLI